MSKPRVSEESDQADRDEEADEERVEWEMNGRARLAGIECWKGEGDHRDVWRVEGYDPLIWAGLAGNAGKEGARK